MDILNNETKINEVQVGASTIVLTDKRLIHLMNGQTAVVGISELSSAEVTNVNVKEAPLVIHNKLGCSMQISIAIMVLVVLYYRFVEKEPFINGIGMSLLGIPAIAVVSLIVLFIIKKISGAMAKEVRYVLVNVTKKDNTCFLYHHFDAMSFEKLRELCSQINDVIYQ